MGRGGDLELGTCFDLRNQRAEGGCRNLALSAEASVFLGACVRARFTQVEQGATWGQNAPHSRENCVRNLLGVRHRVPSEGRLCGDQQFLFFALEQLADALCFLQGAPLLHGRVVGARRE